jgi:hypothetical protein
MLVTDDVAFLRRMSAARSPYTRGEWYDGVKLQPDVNNVISERNEQKHAEIRAKLANGVSIPAYYVNMFTHLLIVCWQG